MSLDEVLVIERTNRKSTNHAVTVDDLSEQAQKQFEIVYRRDALAESADAELAAAHDCVTQRSPPGVMPAG
jgi:hypothetical protein